MVYWETHIYYLTYPFNNPNCLIVLYPQVIGLEGVCILPQLIEVAHGRAKMKPESQRLALSKQMYTGPQIAGPLVTHAHDPGSRIWRVQGKVSLPFYWYVCFTVVIIEPSRSGAAPESHSSSMVDTSTKSSSSPKAHGLLPHAAPLGRAGWLPRGGEVARSRALLLGLCKGLQFPEAGPRTSHGYFTVSSALSLDLAPRE